MDEKENEIEKKIEKRKEKIIKWFKNPHNFAIISILIFAIAVRFYYFWITKNQPLWWDEAEYMSTAKGFAGIIQSDYHFALNRFPGFPLLASLFYIIGINNEVFLRFCLAFIPSIITIFFLYLMMKEMYADKKVALISVAILTLLWEHVFYSNRFHTENLSLIFGFLAIFILFKSYIKNQNIYFIKPNHSLWYILLFSILCVVFRSGNMIFIPVIILFILLLDFYRFPKKFRVSLIIIFLTLFALFLVFIGPLAKKYSAINLFYHYELPPAWNDLTVFQGFYQSLVPNIPPILFYAFLLGIILFLINISIAPELLRRLNRNSEHHEVKADILNIILIFAVLFFFIFMLRQNSFEYRWFFIFLPGMLAFTSKGIIKFSEYASSLTKIKGLAIIFIFIIMAFALYSEWNHTDSLVKNKVSSYGQVRDSGLWIRQNSNKEDIILTASATQHKYYAERKIIDFYVNGTNENEKAVTNKIKQIKPRFLIVSVFEQGFTPKWIFDWTQKHNQSIAPVQVYFGDDEKQQPWLIVYEFKDYDF